MNETELRRLSVPIMFGLSSPPMLPFRTFCTYIEQIRSYRTYHRNRHFDHLRVQVRRMKRFMVRNSPREIQKTDKIPMECKGRKL